VLEDIQNMRSQFVRWDGDTLKWEDFNLRWESYLRDIQSQLSPDDKVHLLLAQIPTQWRDPLQELRQYDTGAWPYERCMAWLHEHIDPVIPRHQYRDLWESCLPKGNSAVDLAVWWPEWSRRANRCNLTMEDKVIVFKKCMLKGFSELLKKGMEHEAKKKLRWMSRTGTSLC
jgi:hypothetical protein